MCCVLEQVVTSPEIKVIAEDPEDMYIPIIESGPPLPPGGQHTGSVHFMH